jgi:hypothetical protein
MWSVAEAASRAAEQVRRQVRSDMSSLCHRQPGCVCSSVRTCAHLLPLLVQCIIKHVLAHSSSASMAIAAAVVCVLLPRLPCPHELLIVMQQLPTSLNALGEPAIFLSQYKQDLANMYALATGSALHCMARRFYMHDSSTAHHLCCTSAEESRSCAAEAPQGTSRPACALNPTTARKP